MLGDFVGAAGCDGQGNALAMGANKMFQHHPAAGPAAGMQHADPMMDDVGAAEAAGLDHPSTMSWGDEFMAGMPHGMSAGPSMGPPMDWAQEMQAMHPEPGCEDWTQQFRQQAPEGEQWAEDFATDQVQTFGVEGEQQLTFEEKQAQARSTQFAEPERAAAEATNWADEFAEGDWANGFNGVAEEDWARLLQMQEDLADGDQDWAEQYRDLYRPKPQGYQFEENNPYLFHENPFAEGRELLEAGTLCEAVLAFEAAVQKDEAHAEAWQYLGTTQAANEKDRHAIAALVRARELTPANPAVLQQLGVSFTNESQYDEATAALCDWITAHPVHGEFAKKALALSASADGVHAVAATPEEIAMETMARNEDYYGMKAAEHERACKLFEAVAEKSHDPEVHAQLGVLYNMTRSFDKAAAHFNAAIQAGRQNDVKLWNRLGATLANGGKHPEAVQAYNRAIDISPGFVRANFNLGISLSAMKQHAEAASQFLRALDMQQSQSSKQAAEGGGGSHHWNNGAMEIWDALRMALSSMGRQDLYDLTWKGDVSLFTKEFPIDPFADGSAW